MALISPETPLITPTISYWSVAMLPKTKFKSGTTASSSKNKPCHGARYKIRIKLHMCIHAALARKTTKISLPVHVASTKSKCSIDRMKAKISNKASGFMASKMAYFRWTTAGPRTKYASPQPMKASTFTSTKSNDHFYSLLIKAQFRKLIILIGSRVIKLSQINIETFKPLNQAWLSLSFSQTLFWTGNTVFQTLFSINGQKYKLTYFFWCHNFYYLNEDELKSFIIIDEKYLIKRGALSGWRAY